MSLFFSCSFWQQVNISLVHAPEGKFREISDYYLSIPVGASPDLGFGESTFRKLRIPITSLISHSLSCEKVATIM